MSVVQERTYLAGEKVEEKPRGLNLDGIRRVNKRSRYWITVLLLLGGHVAAIKNPVSEAGTGGGRFTTVVVWPGSKL
jgi:hypothetical protein